MIEILLIFLTASGGAALAEPQTHPVCEMVAARVQQEYPKDFKVRLAACSTMLRAAEKRGLDAALTLELAWGESRFNTVAVNPRSGCSGILQAAPRWWCPGKKREGCDLLDAGLDAMKHYVSTNKGDEEKALCHFKSGNVCHPLGLEGAKKTMTRVHRLRKRLKRARWLAQAKDNT